MRWVRENGQVITQGAAAAMAGHADGAEWKGLIGAHAQMEVKGWYEKLGFEVDKGMGVWIEEGIEHVGVWRRV